MRRILSIAMLLVVLMAAACAAPADQTPTTGDGPASDAGQQIASSDVSRTTSPDVSDEALTAVAQGNNEFAFDLYHQIRDEDGNLFYSPYSIEVALAMTYAGARGETAEQMADTLHFTLPQEQLHPAFNALDLYLTQQGEQELSDEEEDTPFTLNIANALWGQEEYGFEQEFLDLLAANYGAGMRLLNFGENPEEAREIINEWVSEQTEEKIEDLLQQGVITPNTRLVLTNAIYFNAVWQHTFEESQTSDGAFTLSDGSEVTVPLMTQTNRFGYAEGDGYQAVELPYRNSTSSMVVILPAAGTFDEFESSLDAERVSDIVAQLETRGVALTMPKFEYEMPLSLTETLQEMGMPAAFSGEADFSGMTGDRSLFISDVVHKAFVAVDEEGTEAAAATAVAMAESAMAEPAEMTIDRPFIFLIRDRETGTILFAGRVVDPSA